MTASARGEASTRASPGCSSKDWPPDVLILQGSARAQGHTASAVMRLRELLGGETELLDLSLLDLRPFDYDRPAQADEFDQVVERMLAHDVVIFATPCIGMQWGEE